jgi:hypothetical protein
VKKLVALIPLALAAALLPAAQVAAAPVKPPAENTAAQSSAAGVPTRSLGTGSAADKAAKDKAALRSDAVAIARQTDRPLDKVTAELDWQAQVKAEAQRLAEAYPDAFTGVRITSHQKREVWLGFKGAAPDVRLPSGTEATLAGDQPLNAGELRRATDKVARSAQASFNAETSAVPDMVSGTIDVIVSKAKPADATSKTRQLAAQTVGTSDQAAKLRVAFDPKASSGVEAASGGAKLEVSGTANLHCTSAFSIIKNGVTGMLTAQHCTSPFTHENYNGATEYSTSTVMSTIGTNGDLRWYNSSTNEVPQFRADYSDLRNLYTAPGFSEGEWMCHFGYGNGKSCDTVYRVGVSSNGVSGLTAMTHHYTTGGNSGGPWFFGTGGYGVHRGWTSIWFAERAVFTPLNRVMPAFGAYILVN